MTRQFSAAFIAAILTTSFAGCTGYGSSLIGSQQRHTSTIQRPSGGSGDSPPAGSAYVSSQCSASDSSCAGPWSVADTQNDSWETASINGNGSFQQRVYCAGVTACGALGKPGIDISVVYSWVPTFGGPVDSITTDYQDLCDPSTNDGFPSGCAPINLSMLGKNAQPGQTCVGSPLAIGFPPAGADNKTNDIVQIYAIRALGLASHVGGVAGYAYQTGGGQDWFQLNVSVSAGVGVVGASSSTPYFTIPGLTPDNLTDAVNKATMIMGLTTGTLPIQISKTLNANLKFNAQKCFQNPWSGTFTAAVKRRA